jgi:6-pyruvoyltetrahydropterin/6-carboxytetrahydropterin synthase
MKHSGKLVARQAILSAGGGSDSRLGRRVQRAPYNRRMFHVTKEIRFCYGHRLLHYEGKCRHLHGHNGRAVITLAASALDPRGMVADFSDIKRVVGGWIESHLDHRMLLHKDDPALPALRQQNEPVFIMEVNPTAENIARTIFEFALSQDFPVVEVRLWETDDACAVYRPEH